MKTSKKGLALIIAREGVRLKAYRDAVGVPTIGVGHTHGVQMGQRISMAQALRFLAQDVKDVERVVNQLHLPPSQRMFDALVSFGFNLGIGIFSGNHTIAHALALRDYPAASKSFLLYDRGAGGKFLLGLLNRRKSEKRQFDRGFRAYQRRVRKGKHA